MILPEENLSTQSPVPIPSSKENQLRGNGFSTLPRKGEIFFGGDTVSFHLRTGLAGTMPHGSLEISLLVSVNCKSRAGEKTNQSIGITVAAVVVPQSMAYARLAELPPQFGLYSSFMGVLIYWFFATSKDITIGVGTSLK